MAENRTDFRTRLSRRRLLSGIGALTATLTSPIWRVSTAFGQAAQPARTARRFIGLFSSNGTVASEFFPGCSGSTKPNSCPNTEADTPLTATGLGRILQPLAMYTSQMMVLKGVDMVSTVSNMLGTTTTKPGGSQQSLGFPLQRDGAVRRHHLRHPRRMHRTASRPCGLSLK
jgi:hypothetical protein